MERRFWFFLLVVVLLTAPLAAASGRVRAAQDDVTTSAPENSVDIGEFTFDTDPTQPVAVYSVQRLTGDHGSYVTVFVAVQLSDGSFTGMTPCDNQAVLCQPVIVPAKAALSLADPGDTFFLAKEGS